VRSDSFGLFGLRRGIRLGLLLGQLARMHHHKAEGLVGYPSFTILDLHLAEHALPMPAAWGFVLRPARFLSQERQDKLLLSPAF
jgi:hypothetical protein